MSTMDDVNNEVVIMAEDGASRSDVFRIGDYIFVDTTTNAPYQIGKIDEIIQDASTRKYHLCIIRCYRLQDLPKTIVKRLEESAKQRFNPFMPNIDQFLSPREVYPSNEASKIVSISKVRGKCTVDLFCEIETVSTYSERENAFFYTRSYDSSKQALFSTQASVRVGSAYQAEVPSTILSSSDEDPRKLEDMETLVYRPDHSLSDADIDKFVTVTKSIFTFGLAINGSLDSSDPDSVLTSILGPATRDITLQYAMDTLHKSGYDFKKAINFLLPHNSPKVMIDEMNSWSLDELQIFEQGLEKYGKKFNEIQKNFLPWKSVKNHVEYYYYWKTLDKTRTVRKMVKGNYKSKKNPYTQATIHYLEPRASLTANIFYNPCTSCKSQVESGSFFQCGQVFSFLCASCFIYWKKYGEFKP